MTDGKYIVFITPAGNVRFYTGCGNTKDTIWGKRSAAKLMSDSKEIRTALDRVENYVPMHQRNQIHVLPRALYNALSRTVRREEERAEVA